MASGNGSGGFDPGAGRLLGTNDLQSTIDKFNDAVNTLSSTVANMSSTAGNGITRSPAASASAGGAMFSAGQFPTMSSWANQAILMGQQGGSYGGGLIGQMASGGGANGGGSSFNPPGTVAPQGQPGGPGSPPAGGASPGGSGSSSGGSGGFGFAQPAVQAAGQFGGWAMSTGMSQLNNQTLFNSYGAQMQAQWGGSAQTYQNQAFGNGTNGITNAAAAGNAQGAMQEFGTLTQMSGGVNVTSTAAFNATNAFAFSNQGMGAAAASQLAASVYNPSRALQQQLLTGVSAYGPNGQQTSLSSQIKGLAGEGYIGGGSLNAKTGTFSQSALNASFTANRGTSYMNLQSLGYNSSQIQDIQSTVSQANQAALKGHTSVSNVMGLMSQAEYGSQSQIQGADKKLAGMGVDISTLQLQGNKSAQSLSQQQSQSSTYNDSVKDLTDATQKVTQAFNWFLDKTGLNKVVGAVQGSASGYHSSGMSGWVSGISKVVSAVADPGSAVMTAAMGGGAGSVSATSPMTSQGSSAGSSMSSVSAQARTAVRDAEQQVGKPYQYGATGPNAYDCSGLVMTAYRDAGIQLPRTSQQQWASLKNRSVALNAVREGDIIFSAGSDGSLSAPGHEALMISDNQLIESPHSGADVRIRGYVPGQWQHAARPTGSVPRSSQGTSVSGTRTGYTGSSLFAGNSGGGGSGDSSLGLTANADSMLFSGANGAGLAAGGMTGGAANGGSAASTTANSGIQTGSSSGRLSPSAIENLWTSLGGPSGAAANMARIANAESGDQPGIKQQGQPAATTGWGLYQVTPTSGIRQDGQFGNLLNASNNTKAAIALYKKDGYAPWSSDAVGASLTGMATGGPIMVGERGPELFVPEKSGNLLSAGQTSSLLRGTSAQPSQAPWSATPAATLMLDTLSPANDRARQSGQCHGL